MGNPNGFRVVLLLIPAVFLLLPIAAIIFILERVSNSTFSLHAMRDWRYGYNQITLPVPGNSTSSDPTGITLALNLNVAPTLSILGVVVLACLVSGIAGVGTWELRRVEGTARHQRGWCWAVFVCGIVMIGASAGVLGYASSVQGNETIWESSADIRNNSDRDAQFTRETWGCQIHKFFPTEDWAGKVCSTSKASRYLLIALIMSCVLLLVSLWLLVRSRGGIKWLFGGKGKYGGFPSLYELQPTEPGATYPAQPTAQWYYVQYPQQPGPQWVQYGPPVPPQQVAPQTSKPTAATGQREVYG